MNHDPIIHELRNIRKDIEEECKRKGQSYFNHLLEIQEKYKDRLATDELKSQQPEVEKIKTHLHSTVETIAKNP